ncbi:hypothetical protein G7085_07855 [Tessaracoccus sp. HDW20]|uniref:hypothetical protein n=1 Tax=Tessaracoccus coleopterorum TaxID=2714950 RepID=UPI0018D4A4DA|nr:hypothetical protein [Tessaracoccus coleopterorum]NHB84557.1 hypothetical protein [Tessaracoccus coleopterorum]
MWRTHSEAVQTLLDDPEVAGRVVASPTGPRRLDETLDTFYLADVFMHRWDLAKASGQDPDWEPATAAAMFEGWPRCATSWRARDSTGRRSSSTPRTGRRTDWPH